MKLCRTQRRTREHWRKSPSSVCASSSTSTGQWYIVMLVRNRSSGGKARAERTQIKVISDLTKYLDGRSAKSRQQIPKDDTPTNNIKNNRTIDDDNDNDNDNEEEDDDDVEMQHSGECCEQQHQQQQQSSHCGCRWKVVVVLGPVEEGRAEQMRDVWMQRQRGVIPKAARGEVISIEYNIPGYADWNEVFGVTTPAKNHVRIVTGDPFSHATQKVTSIAT